MHYQRVRGGIHDKRGTDTVSIPVDPGSTGRVWLTFPRFAELDTASDTASDTAAPRG